MTHDACDIDDVDDDDDDDYYEGDVRLPPTLQQSRVPSSSTYSTTAQSQFDYPQQSAQYRWATGNTGIGAGVGNISRTGGGRGGGGISAQSLQQDALDLAAAAEDYPYYKSSTNNKAQQQTVRTTTSTATTSTSTKNIGAISSM